MLGSQLPKHHPEDGSQALKGIRPASEYGSADNWREAEKHPHPPRLSTFFKILAFIMELASDFIHEP